MFYVNPKAFEVTSSNYSLLRFYYVQNKFIDVSKECVVFIIICGKKCQLCRIIARIVPGKR